MPAAEATLNQTQLQPAELYRYMRLVLSKRPPSKSLQSAWTIVLAALIFRLFLLWLAHYHEDPAHRRLETIGMESLMIGRALAIGNGFANPFPGYDAATAWLAPVYPWLAAIGVRLSNIDGYKSVLFCQVLNCIFSALTCWPIYDLGKRIFTAKTGRAAAWLWVFLPSAILMPLEWTWDQSLSALLLGLILSATFRLRRSTAYWQWAGYGILWGVAALTNPSLCALLPFLGIWLLNERRKNGLPPKMLFAAAAIVFLLVLLPWTMRNHRQMGKVIFVKSNFAQALWAGNNPDSKEIYSPNQYPAVNARELQELRMLGEMGYMNLKKREALDFIRANPASFFSRCYYRFVDTWTGNFDSTLDPYVRKMQLRLPYIEYLTLFSALAFAGLGIALLSAAWDSLPLAFCVLLFPIPYYLTTSEMRYRHPIDPVLAILAVVCVERLGEIFLTLREVDAVEAKPNLGAQAPA
jgi:4-amino-4-deoxy-L-arabinose transferase-like glycosyltransferase